MLDKWIKYKNVISFFICCIMVITCVGFDLFRNPDEDPVITGLMMLFFVINAIPYCFKEEEE